MSIITADAIVGEIDLDHPWFTEDVAGIDKVKLPGTGGDPTILNQVSRAQAHLVIAGVKRRADENNDYLNKSLAEALTAERRRIRMSPRQYDYTLVNSYAADTYAEVADDPISEAQREIVKNYVKALNGVEEFWFEDARPRFAALSERRREQFVDPFLAVETKGQLTRVLGNIECFVGNVPAENRRKNNEAAAAAGDEVNDLVQEALAGAAAAAETAFDD